MVVGKLQKSVMPVSISSNEIVPFVISNMQRAEMNKTLFMNSVRPMILPYLIGFAFLVYFLYEFLQ